jgi:hypothetical protein
VREARRAERELHARFAHERVPAPLEARELAAGEHEWFCGVDPRRARQCARSARTRHALRATADCAAHRIGDARAALWQWSERALEAIEYERHNVPAELGEAGRSGR